MLESASKQAPQQFATAPASSWPSFEVHWKVSHVPGDERFYSVLHSPEEMAFKALLKPFAARSMLMCFCYYCGTVHNMAITGDGVGNFNEKYYFQCGRVIIKFPRQQETKVIHLQKLPLVSQDRVIHCLWALDHLRKQNKFKSEFIKKLSLGWLLLWFSYTTSLPLSVLNYNSCEF